MTATDFDELQSQIQASYQAGDYATALDLATQSQDRFPEKNALLAYWRISLLAQLGEQHEAMRLLGDKLAERIWYSDVLLRKSPSLESLQASPEFRALLERNRQVREEDQHNIYPLITFRPQDACREGDPLCPLFIGLHANASIAQAYIDYWKPAGGAGWLVAVPQSSQALYKDAYVWDDLEVTGEEIQRHYHLLNQQYAIDPEQVILAGVGMGGEAAIWLALNGAVQVNGFIAINPNGPYIDELEKWEPFIQKSSGFHLRGMIILDDEEHTVSAGAVHDLVEMLNRGGIPCELEALPGLSPNLDEGYEASLLRAIDYIIGDI
jgi:hypothetical protein